MAPASRNDVRVRVRVRVSEAYPYPYPYPGEMGFRFKDVDEPQDAACGLAQAL